MSCICWFRKALRLHDNPALIAAIEEGLQLLPVFVLDPWFVANAKVGSNRWRFLQQSLEDLDNSLKSLGSRLLILRGKPEEILPNFFDKYNVKVITWEDDIEPYSKLRDSTVSLLADTKGVKIIVKHGHTLYEPKRVFETNGNKVPLAYKSMQLIASKMGKPSRDLDPPSTLPKVCEMQSDLLKNKQFNIPTMKELGIDESTLYPCLFPGGETEAVKRLTNNMTRKSWVCGFEKPKTSPNSLMPSTTVLSPYLKFGCLSARKFYHELMKVYNSSKKHSEPPVSLHGQLLWREFFYTVSALSPNFDRMEGNPICKQIPWSKDEKLLEAWKLGKTGYPFIDALMTQLRQEGWIHHLGRHAVACFLTRGDLWQSWEEGMKVFEEYLLDADWSLNAANWMWLSASCFFYQYFRVYSPITFGKNTDKEGDYIRKYLPVLAKFPSKYIYEPWKAPLADQRAARCIIGKDYPRPIVDHDVARKNNLEKMKNAYKMEEKRKESEKGSEETRKKKKK